MAPLTLASAAWQIALSGAVAVVSMFAFKMIKMRMIFYRLKKQGLVGNCANPFV